MPATLYVDQHFDKWLPSSGPIARRPWADPNVNDWEASYDSGHNPGWSRQSGVGMVPTRGSGEINDNLWLWNPTRMGPATSHVVLRGEIVFKATNEQTGIVTRASSPVDDSAASKSMAFLYDGAGHMLFWYSLDSGGS